MPEVDLESVRLLTAHGLICEQAGALRTTARFQAAMARAALRLFMARAPDGDLRFPIAEALVELEGPTVEDALLVRFIATLLPLEQADVGTSLH